MAEKERLVTFDHALPESLISKLNNSFHEEENDVSGDSETETYAQTSVQIKQNEPSNDNNEPNDNNNSKKEPSSRPRPAQHSRSWPGVKVFASSLIFLILAFGAYQKFTSSDNESSIGWPNRATNTPVMHNSALTSEGARILKAYTTPPMESIYNWAFKLSMQDLHLDPECVMQESPECWPSTVSSTIGIALAHPASVRNLRAQVLTAEGVQLRDFTVYTISNSKEIKQVHYTLYQTGAYWYRPINASELIARFRFKATTKHSVYACLKQITINGRYL